MDNYCCILKLVDIFMKPSLVSQSEEFTGRDRYHQDNLQKINLKVVYCRGIKKV